MLLLAWSKIAFPASVALVDVGHGLDLLLRELALALVTLGALFHRQQKHGTKHN